MNTSHSLKKVSTPCQNCDDDTAAVAAAAVVVVMVVLLLLQPLSVVVMVVFLLLMLFCSVLDHRRSCDVFLNSPPSLDDSQ